MADKLVHATCVALPPGVGGGPADPPAAVLLRGASGCGKSDLALRLIDQGWRLVADDQTALAARGDALLASAPPAIAGLLEIRGLGILRFPNARDARVCLVADLLPAERVERLPEQEFCDLLGVRLPRVALDPAAPSAAIKLRLAARREADAIMEREAAPRSPARHGDRSQRSMTTETDSAPEDEAAQTGPNRVVLVTGLSGAGRSLALDILEDLGFETIDNPPLELLEGIVADPLDRSVALGIDIRTRNFAVDTVTDCLTRLRGNPRLSASLLFMECDDEVLQRRYTESRRRHPLASGRPLKDGIVDERRLIAPLRDQADLLVDTTNLTPADLRQYLNTRLTSPQAEEGMEVFVTSFAYRHGLPRSADLVFDVRFLKNPHYDAELRVQTGLDPGVAAFIEADPEFQPFYDRLTGMLEQLLPLYEKEGKSYLTIAIGCTGGRHRSVMTGERLARRLESAGYRVTTGHRDLTAPPEKS